MRPNEGRWSRIARALGGVLALTCSVQAPLPLAVRIAAFGTMGAYLLFTALTGRGLRSRISGGSASSSEPER